MMKTVIISASIFAGVISVLIQTEPQKMAHVKEIKAKKIKKAKVEKKEVAHIIGDLKIKK